MTRISEAFAKGKAFIPFITCGDPDINTTLEVVRSAVRNGADLVELGLPFSDPTAEGPVIQSANVRALNGGITTDKIFAMVHELRKDIAVPLVFMTYANVVFSYGTDRFLQRCEDEGIDGLILPDVPFEEKEEFAPLCRAHNVALISMVAPTSEDRIAMIAREAEGSLPVCCLQSRRNRHKERDYDGLAHDCGSCAQECECSVRNRLRNFDTRAGAEHGRYCRRCDSGFGNH